MSERRKGQPGEPGHPGEPGSDGGGGFGGEGGAGGRGGDATSGVQYGSDQDWKKATIWWGYLLAVLVCAVVVTIALATLHNQQVTLRHQQDRISRQQIAIAKQAAEGKRAAVGECALSRDLSDRILAGEAALARSKKFFSENPNALPGVPHEIIEQGWKTQQATIDGQKRTATILVTALQTCDVVVPK